MSLVISNSHGQIPKIHVNQHLERGFTHFLFDSSQVHTEFSRTRQAFISRMPDCAEVLFVLEKGSETLALMLW